MSEKCKCMVEVCGRIGAVAGGAKREHTPGRMVSHAAVVHLFMLEARYRYGQVV